MINIYFIIIFFTSFLLTDLSVTEIVKIGGLNIYIADITTFLTFLSAISIIKTNNIYNILMRQKTLLFVTAIFFLSILFGLTKFGGRAIGEGRYLYSFFAFTIPLFFYSKGSISDYSSFEIIFDRTIYVCGIAALLLFIIELFYGGRFFVNASNQVNLQFEDFRGTRFLGTEETYNLTLMWILLYLNIINTKKHRIISASKLIIILVIIVFTKNRAAPIALFTSFSIAYFFIEDKIKELFGVLTISIVSFFAISLILPQFLANIDIAYKGLLDIQGDQTGNWRLLVQYSAFTQGLEHPIFGEGYGGYFAFYVPELNQTVTLPPHNIFIFLFSKSGLIGVITTVSFLISLIFQAFSLPKMNMGGANLKKYKIIFLTIFISQFFYGMAYGFSKYFGLFVGFYLVFKAIISKEFRMDLNNEA